MTVPGAATSLLGQLGSGQQAQQAQPQNGQGNAQEAMVVVPMSIFSGLLSQGLGWLGDKVAGQPGGQIGQTAGDIISSFLPFQVIPPAKAAA